MPFNFHLIQTLWKADRIADLIRTYESELPAAAWPIIMPYMACWLMAWWFMLVEMGGMPGAGGGFMAGNDASNGDTRGMGMPPK